MTIKTQDGKINTIDGKVSCTCCAEPGCCMYFATTDTPTFPDTDLPDAVTINWPGHFEGSADRSGRTYSAGTVSLAINEAKTDWVLSDSATGQSRTVGVCLLREAGGLVIDQFKAEYDFYDPGWGAGHSDYTLPRVSLCKWEYFDNDQIAEDPFGYSEPYTPEREGALAWAYIVYRASPPISAGRPGWALEAWRLFSGEVYDEELDEYIEVLIVDSAGNAFKDGDQNKQDGTYDGITIS
jgi:hypothetical protein